MADECRLAPKATLTSYTEGSDATPRCEAIPDSGLRARRSPRRPTRARPRPRRPRRDRAADDAGRRQPRRRRRPARTRHRRRRPETGQSAPPPARQGPPRQRPQRDPADLPRRQRRGLRTAKFSGRYWARTSDAQLVELVLGPGVCSQKSSCIWPSLRTDHAEQPRASPWPARPLSIVPSLPLLSRGETNRHEDF